VEDSLGVVVETEEGEGDLLLDVVLLIGDALVLLLVELPLEDLVRPVGLAPLLGHVLPLEGDLLEDRVPHVDLLLRLVLIRQTTKGKAELLLHLLTPNP